MFGPSQQAGDLDVAPPGDLDDGHVAHAAATDLSGARNRSPLRRVAAFDRHDTVSLRGRSWDAQWGVRTMADHVARPVEPRARWRYARPMFRRGSQPTTSAADAERQALFEKLAQRPETVCPFLGLAADRSEFEPQATDEHRCYAFGEPEPVSGEQQRNVCLQRGYANCPRYLRGVLVIPTDELEALRRPPQKVPPPPPPPAAPSGAAGEGGGRRRLAVLLVLLLGGYVASSEFDRPLNPSSPEVILAAEPSPSEIVGFNPQRDRNTVLLTLATYRD